MKGMRNYIHRDLEPALRKRLREFPCVVVTGPRQAGKSTLLRAVLPDYAYLTLDDPQVRQMAVQDPEGFLDTLGERGIVDEIQYAPELLSYLKMRIDRDRTRCGRYVLTGSQQFVLMKGVSESLAGRVGLLEVMPFDLAEKRRGPGLGRVLASARGAFEHACLQGSFPEAVVRRNLSRDAWQAAYLQTYLERDVRMLYDIGNLRDFERFLQLLATRCSQMLNLSTFARDLGVGVNTIKRWLSILDACRIVVLLPPYYNNLGKRVTQASKVYFMDCALVCYLTGIRDAEHLFKGPMAGALFENFCIIETFKALLARGVRPQLFYIRTAAGNEVDLLVEVANGKLWPVEFKLSRTPKLSMADALKTYRKTFAALSPERGAVVSLADAGRRLSADADLLSLDSFLARVVALHEGLASTVQSATEAQS